MSKEKQMIDEERWAIAKIMADNFHINGEGWDESDFEWTAHCLQMAGFHKQSEVIKEFVEKLYAEFRMYGATDKFNKKMFLTAVDKVAEEMKGV